MRGCAFKRRYSYNRLDGSTCERDRQKLVDDFNSNQATFLFLISTKAGA